MRPYYFDNMATTPVDPRVVKKMCLYLGPEGGFGNPSSVTHCYGQVALKAVDLARVQVSKAIGAKAAEIIFTSGATESNHLALLGAAKFYQRKGKHIITMKTEHQAVLSPLSQLEREGFEVSYLSPEPNGLLDLKKLEITMRPDTILLSVMQVNNEIGVVQDIAAISMLIRGRGIILHVDAAQSIGKVSVDVQQLGVDLMSLSAHKAYGPKGIGALYIRSQPRIRLLPQVVGGGQEQGLRPGTLATHQIVGMGEAYELAVAELETDSKRILALRNKLWQGISDLPGIRLNGDWVQRVPGNLNVTVDEIAGDQLLPALPELALSSGSACAAANHHPSYVLKALGLSDEEARSSIRFSLGRFTKAEEVDAAVEILRRVLPKLQGSKI